jgi:hypothetical protein
MNTIFCCISEEESSVSVVRVMSYLCVVQNSNSIKKGEQNILHAGRPRHKTFLNLLHFLHFLASRQTQNIQLLNIVQNQTVSQV